MNRQKLEHLIETLDFVRRWQVGQTEAVDREIAKVQENYRTMVGHYYHFRENAFYEHNSPVFPISKVASDYQRRNVDSPQTETSNAMPPNEADNIAEQVPQVLASYEASDVLIPENFDMNYEEE